MSQLGQKYLTHHLTHCYRRLAPGARQSTNADSQSPRSLLLLYPLRCAIIASNPRVLSPAIINSDFSVTLSRVLTTQGNRTRAMKVFEI